MDLTRTSWNSFIEIAETVNAKKVKRKSIFPESKKKTNPIELRSRELLHNIGTFYKFLQSHHKDYISVATFSTSSSVMTDKERDAIDQQTNTFTKQCATEIDNLKKALGSSDAKQVYNIQTLTHLHHVMTLLYYRLQQLSEFANKQRTHRMKRLQSHDSFLSLPPVKRPPLHIIEETSHPVEDGLQLDEQEKKMLEEENLLLHDRLETRIDKAREIEKKVIEIADLHRRFAVEMIEQEDLIKQISEAAVESKTNIDKGNKELGRAAQRGVDFRIFVLLFLIVASLALLFLHSITD